MKYIHVETKNGIQLEKVYELSDVNFFEIMMNATECAGSRGQRYFNIICTFDIETTNMFMRDDSGRIDSDMMRPFSFMYHWQFCIDGLVIFGRTWDEFTRLLSRLSSEMNLDDKHRLVIWVHNLAFEFQHFRRFVNVTGGFYKEAYKPIKVVLDNGIEFRDSYALSNMSLKKFCENEQEVIHYKLSGDDYDYSKIRTAVTPMTMTELAYCYNDVAGLYECMRSRLKEDTLSSIPMTSTGYVRRLYRNAMRVNPANRRAFLAAQFDSHVYDLMRQAFRGGDTHANRYAAGRVLHDVQSFDIASSYPAVLLTCKFPIGKFTRISVALWRDGWCEKHDCAYLIKCRFTDLKYKGITGDPYISESKCSRLRDKEKRDRVVDNGRILYINEAILVLTDIDLKIIKEEYSYTNMFVSEVWAAGYGYLPEEFTSTLLKLYEGKTSLKGVEGKEYEYNKSKNQLNSSYGMCVQRIDQTEVEYVAGEYKETSGDLDEQIEKYFKSRNSFLLYQWGVWCTAHARMRLHMGLKLVGRDAVYWDTDSVKCVGDHKEDFEKLNKKLRAIASDRGGFAYDRKGNKKYLGVFEFEETYKRFKTIGAKKYLVEDQEGKIHSTIAGVSKEAGEKYFKENGFDAFHVGSVIEESGHLVAYYNDDDIHDITVENCTMKTASNIALVDDTYTLGMDKDYFLLIESILKNERHYMYN